MEQTDIEKIYAEISQLPIELAPDPTVLGAPYINEAISKCRNHLNKVSRILLRMSRERRNVKFNLSSQETLLSAEKDRLFAEDDDVRRAPNVRDREAIANTKLRDRLNQIHTLKSELLDLETVERAVKLIHDELVRTSTEIKTQRSLLHADRYSGAAYGDESDAPRDSKGRPLPKSDDIDEAELNALVAEEVSSESVATPVPAEDPAPIQATTQEPEPAEVKEPELQVEEIIPTQEVPETATKGEEDDLLRFLSDAPAEAPTPVESKSNGVKSVKNSDPDDDFLQGIFNNI